MPKVEEFNYFICPECDPESITKLTPEEFRKHLKEFHEITSKNGTRIMVKHADAMDWFGYQYEWEIGGKKFTQHIRQARRHRLSI